jgi:endonuclease/exonuclease/phosphatase family metal-dependent hydrolase
MPPFPKPRFEFEYDPATEIQALRKYFSVDPLRTIPKKQPGHVLLATWNIANLGVQHRRDQDYRLLAEIIGWFDVVAVQEVHSNLEGLRGIIGHLPKSYRVLYSDAGGNDERLTFVFDGDKLTASDEIGEVAPSPNDYKSITLPTITSSFNGFDRSPYLATFTTGDFTFSLVTAHLFFGSDKKPADITRRSLEAAAIAWWANRRHHNKYAPTKDVLALGDFNLPKTDKSDPIYQALTRKGLRPPAHSTLIGSNLGSDMHYDQIMFFPGDTDENFTGAAGVVDFDGAVFRKLWDTRTPVQFQGYVKYYLSDHRPYWAEFRTP